MKSKTMKQQVTFGMMNHPALDPVPEILKAKKMGFDFVDLTLEPPGAGFETFKLAPVQRAFDKTGLGIVGHTGWHLHGNAAYPEVRRGVAESLLWAARHFSTLGAKTMTYHIHAAVAKYIGLQAAIDAQVETLRYVSEEAGAMGVQIVLEHFHGRPDQFETLDALFDKVPALGFHLDIGHANLSGRENVTNEFCRRYGKRLMHVHISDNRGDVDAHMPLGAGTIDWPTEIGHLKKMGYKRTVTLEVFSSDAEYVAVSLRKARAWFKK
ncbi:MAG: sugar phosphate isomerase/epimerase family protein [Candidatus Hydrogenedentota bacterium]